MEVILYILMTGETPWSSMVSLEVKLGDPWDFLRGSKSNCQKRAFNLICLHQTIRVQGINWGCMQDSMQLGCTQPECKMTR